MHPNTLNEYFIPVLTTVRIGDAYSFNDCLFIIIGIELGRTNNDIYKCLFLASGPSSSLISYLNQVEIDKCSKIENFKDVLKRIIFESTPPKINPSTPALNLTKLELGDVLTYGDIKCTVKVARSYYYLILLPPTPHSGQFINIWAAESGLIINDLGLAAATLEDLCKIANKLIPVFSESLELKYSSEKKKFMR